MEKPIQEFVADSWPGRIVRLQFTESSNLPRSSLRRRLRVVPRPLALPPNLQPLAIPVLRCHAKLLAFCVTHLDGRSYERSRASCRVSRLRTQESSQFSTKWLVRSMIVQLKWNLSNKCAENTSLGGLALSFGVLSLGPPRSRVLAGFGTSALCRRNAPPSARVKRLCRAGFLMRRQCGLKSSWSPMPSSEADADCVGGLQTSVSRCAAGPSGYLCMSLVHSWVWRTVGVQKLPCLETTSSARWFFFAVLDAPRMPGRRFASSPEGPLRLVPTRTGRTLFCDKKTALRDFPWDHIPIKTTRWRCDVKIKHAYG